MPVYPAQTLALALASGSAVALDHEFATTTTLRVSGSWTGADPVVMGSMDGLDYFPLVVIGELTGDPTESIPEPGTYRVDTASIRSVYVTTPVGFVGSVTYQLGVTIG